MSEHGSPPPPPENPQGPYGNQPNPYGAPPPPGQPPTQPMGGGLTGPGGGPSVGFFGALFDFSFTHFVTPMIVKIVYILVTVGLAIGWLVFVIAGFSDSAASGLVVLVLGAIGVVIYLALARMTLEFYLAVVRMSEDIHKRLPQG